MVNFRLMAFSLAIAASPASATVYVGTQMAGPNGSGTISVTTDGTVGALSAANILGFSITSVINGIAYASTSGGPGSNTTAFGNGLSATATQLIFDFTSDGFFGIADFVPGNTGFCVDGAAAAFACSGDAPSLGFFATVAPNVYDVVSERRTGIQAIAAVVPEPGTWFLLATGFGIVGGALRRRGAGRVPAHPGVPASR